MRSVECNWKGNRREERMGTWMGPLESGSSGSGTLPRKLGMTLDFLEVGRPLSSRCSSSSSSGMRKSESLSLGPLAPAMAALV